ncbi:MAG TPA: oligopeptide/dipeptide ABC transporter ATP-binding protein [Planctomycetota bacterium]|nr:oligopeptide/dipeptide ABC transporter ATP-binding protein [Planctomycetota bacterium]
MTAPISGPRAVRSGPLLDVRGLVKHFPVEKGFLRRGAGFVRAVDGVTFHVDARATLSLVGESGSGKTTVGRSVLRLVEPTSGSVHFDGEDVLAAAPGRLRALRREMQVIFQDPYSSLNPRMDVESIVSEGLICAGVRGRKTRRERVERVLLRVGLDPAAHRRRYPHEFSGGQRQRIGIARALVLEPRLIVCDEPVSSLDVSVKAQVLNLLAALQAEVGCAYLFISHDLSVVRHLGGRIAVMYLGRLAEIGPAAEIVAAPHHPYTRALLDAEPAAHPRLRTRRPLLRGDPPSPIDPPAGCRFHTRCPQVMDRCRLEEPPAVEVSPGHVSWCFLPAPGGATTHGATRGAVAAEEEEDK